MAIKRGDVTVARDGAKADCVVQLVVFQRLFPGPQAVDQTGQAAGYARRWR